MNSAAPRATQRGGAASMSYDDALRQCGREAAATLAAAVAVTAFFWGALALTMGSPLRLWGMPLWFLCAVAGGYLFSIAAVLWIVKRRFREIPLDLRPESCEIGEGSDAFGEAAR